MKKLQETLFALLVLLVLLYLFGGRGSYRARIGGQWQDIQRPSRFGEWWDRLVDEWFGGAS